MKNKLASFSVLAVAAFAPVACKDGGRLDFVAGAKETLSTEASCPIDRIVATERPDLKGFDLMMGARDKPPADIAADPGRLAVWNKKADELVDNYNRETVVFAKGCDKEYFYVCAQGDSGNQGYTAVCAKAKHPPASATSAASAASAK